MIDELSTRVALAIAALSVLGSGLTFVNVATADAMGRESQALADHLARQFDAIGGLEVIVRFHVRDGTGPLHLPDRVGDLPYRLEVRAEFVRVIVGSVASVAPILSGVHPFPPRDAFTGEELRGLDASSSASITSGEAFVVERTRVSVDGTPTYSTFVYLPH